MPTTPTRLLSVGKDRMIIEYDLDKSNFVDGIQIKVIKSKKIKNKI